MQKRMMTMTITGALLAISATLAPNAMACSQPNFSMLRIPVSMPPALFAPAQPAVTNGAGGPSIVGLWFATFYTEGGVIDQGFDVWHADGTELLNDYTDPIEGNVCLGTWTQTGPQTFKLKHPSWSFDTSGNLTGVVYIYESVTLAPDGNEYEGTYSFNIYDLHGNPLGSITGALKGTRIAGE